MTAAELIIAIEIAGGKLTPEADGQLLCQRIPVEFRAELKSRKAEVVALLLAASAAAPKVSKATPCGNPHCGHPNGSHCATGLQHGPTDDGLTPWHCCISAHCLCGFWKGFWCPCPCEGFVNPYTGKVNPWRRPVEESTPCAKCQHSRKRHCRKGKKSIEVDGVPRACRHYVEWLALDISSAEREPCCDSTSCAEVTDMEDNVFCPCPGFVSPYTRRRTARKPTKESATLALPFAPPSAAEELAP
jgi:hypothetical protein